MTNYGLVSVLPLTTFAAFALLTVSYGLVVQRERARMPLLMLHVVVFIVMVHGTPNLVYGTLRYSWAWKHVGIVDYIQRHGTVNPGIAYLDAYHNWPGFFALGALATEAGGFTSALSFAGWAPVFFNLLDLGALLLIFQTLTRDRRLVWLGAWFFYLGNWVGQDYFSPQALAYFFYLVMIGICLRWFTVAAPKPLLASWRRFQRAVALFYRVAGRFPLRDTADTPSHPLERVGLMMIVILLMGAMASSHQLTPFMAISALTLLVLFGLVRVRILPILMAVLTIAWIDYMAITFLNRNLPWIIESIGQLTSNFRANFINLAAASPGQVFVSYMSRGLTSLVGVLAILGGTRRLRAGYFDLPAMLLTASPVAMLALNSYGGEMVFRVYLFALPFAAFFAASALFPNREAGKSWWAAAAAILLSSLLLVGFLFAYYGKERQYYFTKNEVAAAEYVNRVAPVGSLIADAVWDWPLQYQHYEYYEYFSLASLPPKERLAAIQDPVSFFSGLMKEYRTAYLIITRSQKADVDMTGLMPAGTLDRLQQTLIQSDRFRVILANEDAIVFTLNEASAGVGQ